MSRLSRRQALAGFGSVSLGALLAACSGDDDAPTAQVETSEGTTSTVEPKGSSSDLASRFDDAATCTQTAEQTEGPFYFDVDRVRSDIREDRKGATCASGCACATPRSASRSRTPSSTSGTAMRRAATPRPGRPTSAAPRSTNPDGIVEFTTVYPGWYPGRTVHIHAKVHLDKQTVLTTQFYFDDKVSAKVFKGTPMRRRKDAMRSTTATGSTTAVSSSRSPRRATATSG